MERASPSRTLPQGYRVILPVAIVLLGCRRTPESSEKHAEERSFARGDVVVVERTAAEFFEARVLSATAETLKVQTSEEGEPVLVAPNDAYRVTGAPGTSETGALAICNDRPAHWSACRVVGGSGSRVTAALPSGATVAVAADRVLKPSPVTLLNIRKVFDSDEARRRFEQAAVSAGDPKRPPGWLPEAREPVIARRGAEWFSAHVSSMLADGGARVLFEGSDRPESVSPSSIAPIPPYPGSFSRGDFALVRPDSATEPWSRVRIEGIGPDEAVVVGSDGIRKRREARQLVPVTANP